MYNFPLFNVLHFSVIVPFSEQKFSPHVKCVPQFGIFIHMEDLCFSPTFEDK
jgi:hypothetical protein